MALPRASRVSFGRARALRKALSPPERKLWSALRRDSLGVRFRRQHPIGPYIADFACYPLKIVVEIDGWTHSGDKALSHDAKRDAYLDREGWQVLRFASSDVSLRLESVVEAIALAVRNAQERLEAQQRSG